VKTFPAPPPRCARLVAEGLQLEAKAAELDRAGSGAEAAFYHGRASAKLAEASELCPEGHPDRQALSDLVQDLSLRIIYLESLAGAPSTTPLEDHVAECSVIMDLSAASDPDDHPQASIIELLIKSGVSGSTAELSDLGWRLVAALQKPAELRVFVARVLAADGRRRTENATDADVDKCAQAAASYAALFKALRIAPWVELDIDEKADRIDVANRYQEEGVKLETSGELQAAALLYSRAQALFAFLLNNDPRAKYPKVKEMMEQRVVALTTKVKELGGVPGAS